MQEKSLFPEVEVTRLLSSNLLKMGFASFQDGEKRVIDTNELMAKRIEALTAKMSRPENAGFVVGSSADGFAAGLNAERVEGLLSDSDADAEAGNVVKAAEEVNSALAQAHEDAEQILAQAKEKAEAERQAFMSAAQAQIASERAKTLEQAKAQGYAEGKQKADAEVARIESEFKAREKALEEEYDRLLEGMEAEMIDALTGIYEHLFQVELSSYRSLLMNLLTSALRKIEGGRDFLVHVSSEDYPYVSMEKKQLMAALTSPSATLELVEDITLKKNECMIETDSGIFDCGLGTQLEELGRKLRLLSYDRS